MSTKTKESKKEFIIHEVKEVFRIVLYLTVCFYLLATFKALVLFQLNINEFVDLYSIALIEALVLGKVVALTQNLRIMNVWDNYPLIWSVLYKSVVMTLIVDTASTLEDAIFAHSAHHHSNSPLHPLMFLFAHQIFLLGIFFILYAARGLDRKLGHGTLLKIMIEK